MSTLNINGVELTLNLLDADVMERYETLNKRVVADISEPTQYQGKSTADGMRLQCRIVDKFFDDLFGDGTALKLFEGNNDLGVRMEAFAQVASMSNDNSKRLDNIASKYGIERVMGGKRPQDYQPKKRGRKHR